MMWKNGMSVVMCACACLGAHSFIVSAPAVKSDFADSVDSAPAEKQESVLWDLAADRADARIMWPADVTDKLWFIQGPVDVQVSLPSGLQIGVRPRSAIIAREGRRVRYLYFFFNAGSAESALASAIALCERVGIDDLDPLHEWYTNPRRDNDGGVRGKAWVRVDKGGKSVESIGVEIRQAFNPEKPWQVRLGIGFDSVDKVAATGPSSKPS